MESFKEKFCTCMNYLKNKITPEENYQLVETQRHIYYFSKFSLDINELMRIYQMTKKIKENLFKNMLDIIKYCIRGN
jgi:hypothetical protein